MTRAADWALSVVAAAVLSAVWVVAVVGGDSAAFADPLMLLAWWAAVATPGVFAARLLIGDSRPNVSTWDGPARLLATVTACQPEHRREWGAAMTAELGALPGRARRWRFAVGCARATLFPLRDDAVWPVASATVLAVGVTVGVALPAMTVFAVTFAALIAATAARMPAATAARVPRRPAVTGVAGVAACVAVVTYLVAEHPSAAAALRPAAAVVLAVVLACGARLALVPPHWLAADRLARGAGLTGAAVLGIGFVLASRLPGDDAGGMFSYVIFAPIPIFFVAAAAAAALGRSFRTGVRAAVWTALVGGAWVFVLWLLESVRWYRDGMGVPLDAASSPIGVNLTDAIVWTLGWLPVWGLPLGVFGAAAGAALRRRVSAPVA